MDQKMGVGLLRKKLGLQADGPSMEVKRTFKQAVRLSSSGDIGPMNSHPPDPTHILSLSFLDPTQAVRETSNGDQGGEGRDVRKTKETQHDLTMEEVDEDGGKAGCANT